ncbi:hypothetical protein [Mycoplasmoides pneumoniae]|uniref:hypothetical protein n=1 Tax=Mycoplasmoides pneumoniae TaxID=2104 RepID=UPI003A8C462C
MVQTIPPSPSPNRSKQRHRYLGRVVVTSVVCLVVGVLEGVLQAQVNLAWISPPLKKWVGGLWGSYQARVTETPPPPTTSRLILIRGMMWWGLVDFLKATPQRWTTMLMVLYAPHSLNC